MTSLTKIWTFLRVFWILSFGTAKVEWSFGWNKFKDEEEIEISARLRHVPIEVMKVSQVVDNKDDVSVKIYKQKTFQKNV